MRRSLGTNPPSVPKSYPWVGVVAVAQGAVAVAAEAAACQFGKAAAAEVAVAGTAGLAAPDSLCTEVAAVAAVAAAQSPAAGPESQ